MYINEENYRRLSEELKTRNATLVAVSKTKPVEAIRELYGLGHRDFGENYVQEMVEKQAQLPADIRWHFIGHLQSNKVKYIAPFVHLIHSVDSMKLLKEVGKQAQKTKRTIDVLLQVHIAKEETKFGFDESEVLTNIPEADAPDASVNVKGLMGMASFSDDLNLVRDEFKALKKLYDQCKQRTTINRGFRILSMGMSNDYRLALEEGSNMVRIGSLLFGSR